MANQDEVWVIAQLLVEGDVINDEGRRRVVQSVTIGNPEVTIACVDGTVRMFLARTPILIWDSALTHSSQATPRRARIAPSEMRKLPEPLTPKTSTKAPEPPVPPQGAPPQSTIAAPVQKTAKENTRVSTSAENTQTKSLATITLIVEVILWVLLGLTLVGAIIAAAQTNSLCDSIKGGSCESRPFILPAIAAAAIGTAFYLFGIAIMRAIRLWAQRIAAGLPV